MSLAVFAMLGISPDAARAQSAPTPSTPQSVEPVSKPKVKSVVPAEDKKTEAGLGDRIVVHLQGLKKWAEEHGKERDLHKLILYIDQIPVPGLYPDVIDLDVDGKGETAKLIYSLSRSPTHEGNKEAWKRLLGKHFECVRTVKVGVGPEGEAQFPGDTPSMDFIVIHKGWFWGCTIFLLAALIAFFWLTKASDIIRDGGPDPGSGQRRPFSLGRSQMAFWFFIVVASYIFIWLVVGERDSVTPSVLGLMGISASTALGAVVVDNGKRTAGETQLMALQTEEHSLTEVLNTLHVNFPDPAAAPANVRDEISAKTARLSQVQNEIEAMKASLAPDKSKCFIMDILLDGETVSLHRFQIVVWTLLLGVIFINAVINSLSMPAFDGTLLALMGISSATYVGFKLT